MSASFRNATLLESHSIEIFKRAVEEGIVTLYANNEKPINVEISGEGFPRVDWSEIVTTLLLHDRILLTEKDLTPDIKFPNGKLTLSFPTNKKQKKSILNSLTDPPDIKDWIFPSVLRTSDAYTQFLQGDYVQLQMLIDFFRVEPFLSNQVGHALVSLANAIMKIDLDEFDPGNLACSLGATRLLQRIKWVEANPGSLTDIADSFMHAVKQQPITPTSFFGYCQNAIEIKQTVGDKDFNLLLSYFDLMASVEVPFYRHIIDQAEMNNACILADSRFSTKSISSPFVVNHRTESNIIKTFRISIGEGGKWIPPEMSLREVLHIRKEPWIAGFRKSVTHVLDAVCRGDKDVFQAASDELNIAKNRLRTAVGFQKTGSIITYISAPIALIEAFLGTFVGGIACSCVGAASMLYSNKNLKNAEWVARLP